MPSETPVPNIRKRTLSVGVEPTTISSPPPPVKRQRQENQQRHRTPSSFWDNLSRQWLTGRALREFDRRAVWLAAPSPPHQSGKESIHLTQLKRFARHGGPSLGDLRAYPEPENAEPSQRNMASSQSGSRKRAKSGKESDTSSRTKKSSAYDPAFRQHLEDHGILLNNRTQRPDNWAEINSRIAQPRPSLSPSRFSETAFESFQQSNEEALTEATVMSKAFPIIAGPADIPHSENLPFGNFKDLTDGSIIKAQPDFYDGSRPANLDKRIRDELGPYVVPSTNTAAPCVPNFYTEGKGPKGNTSVCRNQALYDGALGARGIHALRSFVDPETAYDNNAYTITSTYHGGSGALKLYTTHRTPSTNPNRDYEFRMTQLRGWDMTDNPDTFRQGAGALRNARDWAKEKREELITSANGKALNADHSALGSSTQSFVSLSSNDPAHLESETSADELTLDNGTYIRPTHRTPVGARTNSSPKISSNRRLKKKPVRVDRGPGTGYRGLQKI